MGQRTVVKAEQIRPNAQDNQGRQPAPKPQLHTVTQLAAELGITARTLRFYEGKGLITPSRLGTTRVYMARDRARMILILRGKRLGFSLREIADYLDLYDIDPTQKAQSARLLKLVGVRMAKLEQQRIALDEMIQELVAWKTHAETILAEANAPKSISSKSD
jgi:DNA-binding transcriptional MerR regulator